MWFESHPYLRKQNHHFRPCNHHFVWFCRIWSWSCGFSLWHIYHKYPRTIINHNCTRYVHQLSYHIVVNQLSIPIFLVDSPYYSPCLIVSSPGVAPAVFPSAPSFAADLAERGWATIDGFLPGPVADELRRVVLEQKAAGKLCCLEEQLGVCHKGRGCCPGKSKGHTGKYCKHRALGMLERFDVMIWCFMRIL